MIRIFLDQDGVVANFVKSSVAVHSQVGNCEPDYVAKSWNYFTEDWGITASEFWKQIDKSPKFWHDLEPFDYFDDLINLVNDYDGNFKVLTSPANSENCYSGKFYWINKHFKFSPSKRAILHSDKSALVKDEDCVLIDDAEHNCDQWRAAGGKAILMPQQWNSNSHIEDKIGYVRSELINYYGEM